MSDELEKKEVSAGLELPVEAAERRNHMKDCELEKMVDERQFMENLLCTRFNFFLMFFGLVVAGAVATNDTYLFRLILVIGFVISVPLAMTIGRAQFKLGIILNNSFLYNKNATVKSAVLLVECEAMNRRDNLNIIQKFWVGNSRQKLIGYIIPVSVCLLLLTGAILSFGVEKDKTEGLKWIW
jgi:hypothetical protein